MTAQFGATITTRSTEGVNTTADLTGVTLSGVDIDHGSTFPDGTIEPGNATIVVQLEAPGAPSLSSIMLGDDVTVTAVDPAGKSSTRFTGSVTDMTVQYDDAAGWVLQLVAVENITDLSETRYGDALPAATAGERILTVAQAANYPVGRIDTTGPDDWDLIPVEASAPGPTVLEIIQASAKSDMGLVSVSRTGVLTFHGRQQLAASNLVKLVVHPDNVATGTVWTRNLEGITTRALIPLVNGAIYTDTDTERETLVGRVFEMKLDPDYVTDDARTAACAEVLKRRSGSEWLTEAISLPLDGFEAQRYGNALDLEVGDILWVKDAPTPTPAAQNAAIYLILGWSERIDPGGDGHWLDLRVVDYSIVRDRAAWGNLNFTWATAGETRIDEYEFAPPTLAAGVAP